MTEYSSGGAEFSSGVRVADEGRRKAVEERSVVQKMLERLKRRLKYSNVAIFYRDGFSGFTDKFPWQEKGSQLLG